MMTTLKIMTVGLLVPWGYERSVFVSSPSIPSQHAMFPLQQKESANKYSLNSWPGCWSASDGAGPRLAYSPARTGAARGNGRAAGPGGRPVFIPDKQRSGESPLDYFFGGLDDKS